MAQNTKIVVGIQADARGIKGGVAQASNSVRGMASSLAGMAGMIAGAFGVSRIVGFARAVMTATDATAKQAKALGASLEGMIGLQHAAQLSGASVEQLGTGVEQMNKRLGSGDYADILTELGTSAEKLSGLKADEKFIKIADSISKITDPTKQAYYATELFGRGGQKLMRTMIEGGDSIRAMAQEAVDLGVTLNEVDAKKFEDVNDNLLRVKQSIKGAVQTMLVEMAPVLDSILEKAVDIGKAFVSWQQGGAKFNEERGDEWGEYYARTKDLQARLARGEISREEFAALDAQNRARRAAITQEKMPGFGSAFEKMDAELAVRAEELAKKFEKIDPQIERNKIIGLFEEGRISQDVAAAAIEDIDKNDPMMQQAQEAMKAMQGKASALTAGVATPWEKAQADMAEAQDLFAKGLISEDTLARAVAQGMADSPAALAEKERLAWMQEAMKEMPQEAVTRSVDALSGGDIRGQVMRGQLGGAQNVQQEQLNIQKRMERWLSLLAGGGAQTPMTAWGR